ncbi:MAG: tRNA pseudouridine(13) synthase TruD [Phycisphaerae bacterium]
MLTVSQLPRLFEDFTRGAGTIKLDYEDFEVEEIPLYEPSGEGTHSYFLLEKRGLNTTQAINNIAQALGAQRRDFGYAGRKDSRAVTRQWVSIEHVPAAQLQRLQIPRIEILDVQMHRNKLKLGHLKGNRFRIRVRQTQVHRLEEFRGKLDELARIGVPNYFGPQRFGARGDNADVGRAVLTGDWDEALDLILGCPDERDFGDILQARRLYEKGDYESARSRWPGMFVDQRRALKTLATTGKKKRAFQAIDRSAIRFYVSALQSALFNQVVAMRLPLGLHVMRDGDLAWRHPQGAIFAVPDAAKEQPRADTFEISPTGPLFGHRMTTPEGLAATQEAAVFENAGLPPEAFQGGKGRAEGGRRPLRFPVHEPKVTLGADDRGPYLELQFELPRGCYATALLRELFEDETVGGLEAPSLDATDNSDADGHDHR